MAATVEFSQHAQSIGPKSFTPGGASEPHGCPACGTSIDLAAAEIATRRIKDLEAQLELLKAKATAAVDRCADYEDQLRSLKASPPDKHIPQRSQTFDTFDPSCGPADEPRPTTANSTLQSRFSFLTGRRGSPLQSNPLPHPPPRDPALDASLQHELNRERALRVKAEARVQTVDSEIEELSVQLFSQANEMVAEERRARAKLEERVELLERRDREKMGRLERLEKAVSRVERVKKLLEEPAKLGVPARR